MVSSSFTKRHCLHIESKEQWMEVPDVSVRHPHAHTYTSTCTHMCTQHTCIPMQTYIYKQHYSCPKSLRKNILKWWMILQLNDKQFRKKWLPECQLKTLSDFLLPWSEWPRSIKQMTKDSINDVGKEENLFIVGGSASWHIHYRNQYGSSSECWKSIYHKIWLCCSWTYTQRTLDLLVHVH